MRRVAAFSALLAGCGPASGGDECDGPIHWVSEEPDGFTFGAHATPDRVWVQHEGVGEERQWFTANACGGDRRELPAGFRLSLFRSWENLACDMERNELYRVDDKLLPLGGPIARQVDCWFKQADDFGLTFRLDTRQVLRVTDAGVEPLGLFLPETTEEWRPYSGDGLMDANSDSVFVVANGGLFEVGFAYESSVVGNGVAWVSTGRLHRAEHPRWLLLWETSPVGTPEEDAASARLFDLTTGEQEDLLTTDHILLDPPWLWTSSSVLHVDDRQKIPLPEGWKVRAKIDSERLLLQSAGAESTSVWTPETGSQIELGAIGIASPGPDGAIVTKNGRRWVYPYDGSPGYDLRPSQPAFSTWAVLGDWYVGSNESGDLIAYDLASEQSTTLDHGVTDVHPTIFKHPDSPPIVFYEKPDGELSGLWSVKLE